MSDAFKNKNPARSSTKTNSVGGFLAENTKEQLTFSQQQGGASYPLSIASLINQAVTTTLIDTAGPLVTAAAAAGSKRTYNPSWEKIAARKKTGPSAASINNKQELLQQKFRERAARKLQQQQAERQSQQQQQQQYQAQQDAHLFFEQRQVERVRMQLADASNEIPANLAYLSPSKARKEEAMKAAAERKRQKEERRQLQKQKDREEQARLLHERTQEALRLKNQQEHEETEEQLKQLILREKEGKVFPRLPGETEDEYRFRNPTPTELLNRLYPPEKYENTESFPQEDEQEGFPSSGNRKTPDDQSTQNMTSKPANDARRPMTKKQLDAIKGQELACRQEAADRKGLQYLEELLRQKELVEGPRKKKFKKNKLKAGDDDAAPKAAAAPENPSAAAKKKPKSKRQKEVKEEIEKQKEEQDRLQTAVACNQELEQQIQAAAARTQDIQRVLDQFDSQVLTPQQKEHIQALSEDQRQLQLIVLANSRSNASREQVSQAFQLSLKERCLPKATPAATEYHATQQLVGTGLSFLAGDGGAKPKKGKKRKTSAARRQQQQEDLRRLHLRTVAASLTPIPPNHGFSSEESAQIRPDAPTTSMLAEYSQLASHRAAIENSKKHLGKPPSDLLQSYALRHKQRNTTSSVLPEVEKKQQVHQVQPSLDEHGSSEPLIIAQRPPLESSLQQQLVASSAKRLVAALEMQRILADEIQRESRLLSNINAEPHSFV